MKRPDGDMAYCPMCHQPNKYLGGAFVYLTDLKAVAAIGHECAAKENRAAADKDYRARRDQRAEEDYLLANLPQSRAKWPPFVQSDPLPLKPFGCSASCGKTPQMPFGSFVQSSRRGHA